MLNCFKQKYDKVMETFCVILQHSACDSWFESFVQRVHAFFVGQFVSRAHIEIGFINLQKCGRMHLIHMHAKERGFIDNVMFAQQT